MKAQTPLMRPPFTNALLLIDNGLTNKKTTHLNHLLFMIIMSTSCGGGQNLQ